MGFGPHSVAVNRDVTVEYAFTADGQLGNLGATTTCYVYQTAGGDAPVGGLSYWPPAGGDLFA